MAGDGEELELELDREREWRVERLLELGAPLEDAELLADAGVDYRRFRDLIAAGCPPMTATRILA